MAAKLDVTEWSVVVWCKECPWFSRIAYDEANGHDLAVAHEHEHHPGSEVAAYNRWYWVKKQIQTRSKTAL